MNQVGIDRSISCTIVSPYSSQAGGAELSLIHLLKGDHSSRVNWSLACLGEGQIPELARELRIPTCVLGLDKTASRKLPGALGKLRAFTREQSTDLLLGWVSHMSYLTSVGALLTGTKASWFQKGGARQPLSKVNHFLMTRGLCGLLANSSPTAIDQSSQTPGYPIHVVPSAVDTSKFDEATLGDVSSCRKTLGLPNDVPLLCLVGRLQRWKGIDTLIESMPKLIVDDPRTTAVIVGGPHPTEPSYLDQVKQKVESLGIQGNVIFTGAVAHDRVPQYMQAADVIVHASHHEPFGIVLVEAMSLGKPLIATRLGGPSETVTHGENGLLIDPEDPDQLAAAVLRYRSDELLRNRVSAGGIQRAKDYTVQVFVNRMAAAVQCLVKQSDLDPGIYKDGVSIDVRSYPA